VVIPLSCWIADEGSSTIVGASSNIESINGVFIVFAVFPECDPAVSDNGYVNQEKSPNQACKSLEKHHKQK
jgi:hypothetical protein